MPFRLSRFANIVGLALTLSAATAAWSQATPTAREIPDSRLDVYLGYGYWHPINSGINGYQYTDISNLNATASITGYFNRYVGVQIEGGYFNGPRPSAFSGACPGGCYAVDQRVYTAQAGPVLRWPLGRFIPFIHALGGGERVNGPVSQPLKWGWGVTGGAGIDYVLPWFHDHVAVRPIQADFQYSQVVYGPLVLPAGVSGGFGEIDALKLSGGVVARFGEPAEKHLPMLGCTTEPGSVFPGEPVQVHGSTLYLNPHKKAVYTWTSNGGRITPHDADATIDTTGMSPGDYTVAGHVQEGEKGKERASCTAPFMVKAYEPPTLSCTANPSTASSGTTVDIATVGTSPQNRPLTYSYSTTAGQITSNGATAKLSTAGLGEATITVTCNLVDDLGKTASATTTVTVTKPVLPQVTQTQALCSVAFNRDRKRPARVDNEAKGCLDDIALTMNQQSGANLVLIGNASPDERPETAAERTLNIRQYLTQEKGIESSRIEVRVGDTSGRTARTVLVPPGAVFGDTGTQTFDEHAIQRHGQAYGTGHAGAAGRTPVVRSHNRRRRTPLPPATDAPAPTATVPQ